MYNLPEYNVLEYNANTFVTSLPETLTPTDATLVFSVSILKSEVASLTDVLAKTFSMASFTETVGSGDDDSTQSRYSLPMYNTTRYNSSLYGFRKKISIMKSETITPVDVLQPFTFFKGLAETLTASETFVRNIDFRMSESTFLSENFQREISNKGLSDTVKVNIWLTIARKPPNSQWGL